MLIRDSAARVLKPLGLDKWTLRLESGAIPEGHRADCEAWPAYREATIRVDYESLTTGEDVDEMIVHELTHCITGPLHDLTEELAEALSESVPESHQAALAKLLDKRVQDAAEKVVTDLGQVLLHLLREAGHLDKPVPAS